TSATPAIRRNEANTRDAPEPAFATWSRTEDGAGDTVASAADDGRRRRDGSSIHAPIASAGRMPKNTRRHDRYSATCPATAGPTTEGRTHAPDSSASRRGRSA